MNRLLALSLMLLGSIIAVNGQTVPTVTQSMPTRTLVVGGAPLSINLRDYFSIPTVTGSVVQFDTTKGKFNAELYGAATDTPKTVANFGVYLNRGAYTNGVIQRVEPNFVIQTGGYTLNGTSIDPVTTDAPVQNEPKYSNIRGTLAMAKTNAGPSTATSQWFINLKDNSAALDAQNGGFTVFGRVLGTGMTVVDAIAAVPIYDVSAQLGADFKQMPLLNNSLTASNIVLIKTSEVVSIFPELGTPKSVLSFADSAIGSSAVATGEITASTMTLKPVAAGSTTVTVKATDTNGSTTQTTFAVNVVAAPAITTQPASQTIAQGQSTTLSVAASGGATYQWQRNGADLTNVTSATVNITNMQPGITGLYTAVATSGGTKVTSNPAILGVSTSSPVIGDGTVVGTDIPHPNGNHFDQVLATGGAEAISNQGGRTTRTSFIDLQDDIVQVEFSGPGTLAILFDAAKPAAPPTKYNQPGTSYVKGHASIVITGADERTNVSVFCVGRATAYDPTGVYNILQAPSAANDPSKNGSSLFVGHETTTYDAVADIARISISSTNGKFGGIRAANVLFYDVQGLTGIYAPGIAFQGPIYVGGIRAYETATPVLKIGSTVSDVRITGGDLAQNNGQPVQVSGITQIKFTPGSNANGDAIAVKLNEGILHQNGTNVTDQLVVYPQ